LTDRSDLVPGLAALFAETFHVEAPAADTDLLENGLLDSLQLVELLLQIELQFGRRIAIENIDLDDLRTLRGIAGLIARPDGTARRDSAPMSALATG